MLHFLHVPQFSHATPPRENQENTIEKKTQGFINSGKKFSKEFPMLHFVLYVPPF